MLLATPDHQEQAEDPRSHRQRQAFLRVQEEFGTFDSYIWRFVDGILSGMHGAGRGNYVQPPESTP